MWNYLSEKGKFATLIGLLFAAPYNGKAVFDFFRDVNILSEQYLRVLVVVNIIAMVWFILPSKVELSAGKIFTMKAED